MDFSRRKTLGLIALGGAAACTTTNHADVENPATHVEAAPAKAKHFLHGVASGDPRHDSVVLWTRASNVDDLSLVTWEIATDKAFENLLAAGESVAKAENDFTIKVIGQGLKPGATYYYRFTTHEEKSPVGRTKTLPVGALDKLGVALVSCSNYPFGFFNAYAEIAKDEAIDVVLHTGDYIYEYGGADGWGHETGATLKRTHAPAHEIVSLADYRMRHAQYKSDKGSQAMHAAHPLLCIWDDHESANNPWKDGAQNHQPETEGDWPTRRAASLKAYYEWMPIREPEDGMTREQAWRSYSFGDLATLVTMESRHTARGEQIDYAHYAEAINSWEEREAFMQDVVNAPRAMISKEMEDEFRSSFGQSVQAGQPWRIVGSASPIARMLTPNIAEHGITPDMNKATPEGTPPSLGTQALFWKGQWNLPFYTDTWDGYPRAREEFYDVCQEVGATDLFFLTGDSHSFWANTLADEDGKAMGVEIGTAGVTSPGDFVESGWPDDVAEKLDRVFEQELDEVRWTDNMHQGYVRVVYRRDTATVDYVAMDTVLAPDYRAKTIRTEHIVRVGNSIGYKDQA